MQYLIGPDVFPLYWYWLQAVLIVITVVAGALAGIALLTAPDAVGAALRVAGDFWWFALQAAAVVTLTFAVLERVKARFSFLERFDARKLDAGVLGMRGGRVSVVSRADTVFEMATTAILLLWWIEWLVFPSEWLGVVLRLSPAAGAFFYPVLALCVVDFVRLTVDFLRPYRTLPRVALRFALNTAWLVLIVLAFRTPGLIEIAENVRAENPENLRRVAALCLDIALFVLGIVTAALVATDAVRLVRR
jgi:hypothetical protein